MHHAHPSAMYQPRRVGIMLECSPGELLARAAVMLYDDKGHRALKDFAALKDLNSMGTRQAVHVRSREGRIGPTLCAGSVELIKIFWDGLNESLPLKCTIEAITICTKYAQLTKRQFEDRYTLHI